MRYFNMSNMTIYEKILFFDKCIIRMKTFFYFPPLFFYEYVGE